MGDGRSFGTPSFSSDSFALKINLNVVYTPEFYLSECVAVSTNFLVACIKEAIISDCTLLCLTNLIFSLAKVQNFDLFWHFPNPSFSKQNKVKKSSIGGKQYLDYL